MGAMIDEGAESLGRELGLRKTEPASAEISRAPSPHEEPPLRNSIDVARVEEEEAIEGVKPHVPESERESPERGYGGSKEEVEGRQDTRAGQYMEVGIAKAASVIAKMKRKDDDKDGEAAGESR